MANVQTKSRRKTLPLTPTNKRQRRKLATTDIPDALLSATVPDTLVTITDKCQEPQSIGTMVRVVGAIKGPRQVARPKEKASLKPNFGNQLLLLKKTRELVRKSLERTSAAAEANRSVAFEKASTASGLLASPQGEFSLGFQLGMSGFLSTASWL